jgi:RimK family alpha-L-glutamate ligase
MATIAVVGGARNETNRDLVYRWRLRGIDAVLASPAELLSRIGPGDTALVRLDILPTLDGIEPGMFDVLAAAEFGVRLVNHPTAVLNAHDKLRTARLVAAAGIPQPWTVGVRAGDRLDFPPPLVVKPRFGSWGADVYRCETKAEIYRTFSKIATRPWFLRHGAIVQELLPPPGHDLRVLVARGRVIGCAERLAAPGEWRTNVSLGGTARPATADSTATALATAAVAALGGDFFGVDLFPVDSGYVVLEVNAAVEFDDTYLAVTGDDIYGTLATALDLLPAVVQPTQEVARIT